MADGYQASNSEVLVSQVRQLASISSQAALEVMAAAQRAAVSAGQHSAIAVVDATGYLCAFVRMDGAPVQAIQIAQDKAYTAAGFGIPTAQWHEFITQDAPLAAGAPTSIPDLSPTAAACPGGRRSGRRRDRCLGRALE
ncbi:heme-binding protein [Streptomyces sp. M19]